MKKFDCKCRFGANSKSCSSLLKRYHNLYKHWEESGITSRTHKSQGKSRHNVTSLKTVETVIAFITNIAAAVVPPFSGRLPNFKDERVVLLPTDMSKMEVYRSDVTVKQAKKMVHNLLSRVRSLIYGINSCRTLV